MKPVNSQLEDSRDINSEAMMACVAITMVPSALDRKTAVTGMSGLDLSLSLSFFSFQKSNMSNNDVTNQEA